MAIKPSRRFSLWLLCMHSIAALVVYSTAVPLAVRWTVIALILISLIYHLARDAFLLLSDSWREISLDQGGVNVVIRDGTSFLAQVTGVTVVSPHLIIFRLKLSGHRYLVSRVIFPDALGAGGFRELCTALRFS